MLHDGMVQRFYNHSLRICEDWRANWGIKYKYGAHKAKKMPVRSFTIGF